MRDDSDKYPRGGAGKPVCAMHRGGDQYDYACERVEGHTGEHAALIASPVLDTLTWPNDEDVVGEALDDEFARPLVEDKPFTDEQRLATIRRLAETMGKPVHILTQEQIDQAAAMERSNAFSFIAEAPVEPQKPRDWARATFTLETPAGQIIEMAFEAHQAPEGEEQFDVVSSPVATLISALRGMGFRS